MITRKNSRRMRTARLSTRVICTGKGAGGGAVVTSLACGKKIKRAVNKAIYNVQQRRHLCVVLWKRSVHHTSGLFTLSKSKNFF